MDAQIQGQGGKTQTDIQDEVDRKVILSIESRAEEHNPAGKDSNT